MTRHDLQEQIENGYMSIQAITPVWLVGLSQDFMPRIYEPCHDFWLSVWNERRRREVERASKRTERFKRKFL